MTMTKSPVSENEIERLHALSELDVDFSGHRNSFKNLAQLAAKIAGTNISLVNLVDAYTQWTISGVGLDIELMAREDSACQYTILTSDYFEVHNMDQDDRFKDKFYVTGEPMARYYLGVPLVLDNGLNIGGLCVLDQEQKELDAGQVTLLKIIAAEIVTRLESVRESVLLNEKVREAEKLKRKVAHDVRGPLAGIIGLAQIIESQGLDNDMGEVLELVSLIQQSGNSLIDLTAEILGSGQSVESNGKTVDTSLLNLDSLKTKVQQLYGPQAFQKGINLQITTGTDGENTPVSGSKLLQIAGNLVGNALKFTGANGTVSVDLTLSGFGSARQLQIKVSDSGRGLGADQIQAILEGASASTSGTNGEQGFGFGLTFVKQLVDQASGTMNIISTPGNGATFTINLPQV
jgi:signal transduction histidine kinase